MQVRIQHKKIQIIINMLYKLSLTGTKSRHRTKFIKLLDARLAEIAEQETEIMKEYCNLDEDDKPKTKQVGNHLAWDIKEGASAKDFQEDRDELYDEELVIEGEDYAKMLGTVKTVLAKCDEEFSGAAAEAYDYLCDQFGIE